MEGTEAGDRETDRGALAARVEVTRLQGAGWDAGNALMPVPESTGVLAAWPCQWPLISYVPSHPVSPLAPWGGTCVRGSKVMRAGSLSPSCIFADSKQSGKIEEGEFGGKKGAEEPTVPQPL